ncbi:hypothetical protein PS870_02400 [Pseudomonas fluorescens]|uniref:Phage tail protein n=1 Tax=Pseudomonas fluorescens TaxID=294 RepID=A0A5E7JUC3_PSEFL|nr:phage tail protein [Pseudomonas fluorescens]VVO92648.1 hypothetical protein PS870_02400 [Pseudomonas fluorescens]
MGASITLVGENLIAQKQAAHQGLEVTRFIFANVPGLDPSGPVDRAAPKPAAGQIVHVYEIPDGNAGYVNPNQVVYSSQIGSDVGDWDFNWIGLESAEGTLFAVAYVPLQIKRRNIPPLQIGNNLTRNFLVAFDGAQALTGITIDASTWQHDFTVRLAGIDERERLSNRDVFGRACFFGSSLQLEKVGSVYQLKPGTAYVEGVRVERSATLPVAPPVFPVKAWLDVALQRELNDVVTHWQVVFAADKADYTDSAGVRHYCVVIADLPNANTVIDLRSVEPISGPLVSHFAARIGDYPDLRARSTTKTDVGLSNLPNAKSDSLASNSSEVLATTKLTKAIMDLIPFHGQQLYLTPGVFTWAVPEGVTHCWVEVIGAGGGGGFYGSSPGPGGGGGGGIARKLVDLAGVVSVTVTVGTGGIAATVNGSQGGAGTSSAFGTYCSATGGAGGRVDSNSAAKGVGVNGDENASLGMGNNALSNPLGSFYGGSGGGGESGFAANDPSRPITPGMGGGGRYNNSSAPGAHGAVKIRWFGR